MAKCSKCKLGGVPCPVCKGKGKIDRGFITINYKKCSHCKGSGQQRCGVCDGTGKV